MLILGEEALLKRMVTSRLKRKGLALLLNTQVYRSSHENSHELVPFDQDEEISRNADYPLSFH